MNKRLLLLLVVMSTQMYSQTVLLPHIGLTVPPQNSDPICDIPVFTGDVALTGFQEGDIVPDFTLYKPNGDSVRLSSQLLSGKPVLLVGGNTTCPVFRNKIQALNDMTTFYAGQLQVFVIYGVEAHPIIDVSPYSGQVWTTSANQTEGVLFEQPETYSERLAMIDTLLNHYTLIPEILVDGPCNEWWNHYGPAPNNAYLIDTNGVVVAKHGWFHRTPDNMWCEIDSLLGTNSGNCVVAENNGFFGFTLDSGDSLSVGTPQEVLAIHCTLHNFSVTDNVQINIAKTSINLPDDWQSALCADVCYAPTVSSINITLAPNESQPFIFYFYTGAVADSGMVRVRFRNNNNNNNTVLQRFFGKTESPNSLNPNAPNLVQIYPNPVGNDLMITTNMGIEGEDYFLFNPLGQLLLQGKLSASRTHINTDSIPTGLYFLQIGSQIRNRQVYRVIKQ